MTTIQVQPTNLDETASALFTQGLNGQPHDLLGQHPGPAGLTITVYRPMARTVAVRLDTGDEFGLLHAREGLWSATVPGMSETHDYRILVSYDDGAVIPMSPGRVASLEYS